MWKQLKQMISDGIGKRRSRRRNALPCFRGRFEPLETRNVLSATIGVMTVDLPNVQLTVVAIWETPPASLERLSPAAATTQTRVDDAPWESLSFHPDGNVYGHGPGPIMSGMARPPLAILGSNPNSNGSPAGEVVHFAEDGLVGNSTGNGSYSALGAQAGNSGAVASTIPQGNNAAKPHPDADHFYPPIYLLQRDSAALAASYFTQSDAGSVATQFANEISPRTLASHDSVYNLSSSDSLLLAASDDSRHSSALDDALSLDDSLDDDFTSTGGQSLAHQQDSLLDENIAQSLDALHREQAAVDAVLAELHDIPLKTEKPHADTPTSETADNPATADQPDRTVELASQQRNPAPAPSDGGMVLLQPTGDANSSAYDLAAAYLNGFDRTTTAPMGVEATVGIYQAIDVGNSESRPKTAKDVSVTKPASAASAGVSVENTPANKSEQPS